MNRALSRLHGFLNGGLQEEGRNVRVFGHRFLLLQHVHISLHVEGWDAGADFLDEALPLLLFVRREVCFDVPRGLLPIQFMAQKGEDLT